VSARGIVAAEVMTLSISHDITNYLPTTHARHVQNATRAVCVEDTTR
jgi:hypothetical protein